MSAYLGAPPAWRIGYAIEVSDTEGWVTGWRWTGECSDARFRLIGSDGSEPLVAGIVQVTSAQPYESDAREDTLRAARDLCGVLAVTRMSISFRPQLPPCSIEALPGARHMSGAILIDSVSAAATVSVAESAQELAAAGLCALDPQLRANADTYPLAVRQENDATRFITLYRIYDAVAQSVLNAGPRLLESEATSAVLSAARQALASTDLDKAQRDRVAASLQRQLERITQESRPSTLARHFSQLLQLDITPSQINAIEGARNRFAHGPASEDTVLDSEVVRLLAEIVRESLLGDLGIDKFA